jgi:hypothetical protein
MLKSANPWKDKGSDTFSSNCKCKLRSSQSTLEMHGTPKLNEFHYQAYHSTQVQIAESINKHLYCTEVIEHL